MYPIRVQFSILATLVWSLWNCHLVQTDSNRPERPRPPFPEPKTYRKPYVPSEPYQSYPSNRHLLTNLTGHHGKYSSERNYCDPRDPPGCLKKPTWNFCINDYEYPSKAVKAAIKADVHVSKKLADVARQSTGLLVDGLRTFQEEYFDYSTYTGRQFDKGNWIGHEGYICPSKVLYVRPTRARNVQGDWRVIVQGSDHYSQTERIETCLYAGRSCRILMPCYKSQCLQKFAYRRLLSFDPCHPERGLFIDVYKLPSACSCTLSFDHDDY